MSTLKKSLLAITVIIIFAFIGKAVLLEEAVTTYLITFFFVGAGLALLRLFVNAMIGKMKGKSIFVKIAFFAVLLGFGLPFQNWFRKEVIFAMDSTFMFPSITVLVASVIFMTIIFGIVGTKIKSKQSLQV